MSTVPSSSGTLQRPGLAWPGRTRRGSAVIDGVREGDRGPLGLDDEPVGLPIALPVSATVTLIRGMEVGVRGVRVPIGTSAGNTLPSMRRSESMRPPGLPRRSRISAVCLRARAKSWSTSPFDIANTGILQIITPPRST